MASLLLAIAFGTFVSEDLAAIATGLLIRSGDVPAAPALAACALGILLGDIGLWGVGRALGPRVLQWRFVAARLPDGRVGRARAWFERHAFAAIIASRFAPGTRLPLYVAAGACRTPFRSFAAASLIAVGLWTPALVGASAAIGEPVTTLAAAWLTAGRITTLAAALAVLLAWRLGLQLASRRGRQQIAAAIARAWRWEFWPMWLFYLPVAAWTVWLACRHGGYRTITAANPGMPDGGVVGESKFAILSRLPPEWTIPSVVIEAGPAEARQTCLRDYLSQRAWPFPLVLKPDVGQRGMGVRMIRDLPAAFAYLERAHGRVLVQPYHPGPYEAGVFYYRMPGWPHGRVLCLTDKQFPFVVGDARSTIADLVWAEPRYRMQARTFLARFGERRHDIPARGQRVQLAMAGNHAQGTMFTDGEALITPALEERIDEIARAYDGFFFGRFDIRYGNREAFMAGRDLAIVELNGVTAECTNIYDPARSLFAAYRQLFVQWRLAFTIGAANRRAGHAATTTRRLTALLRAHLAAPAIFPISD